MNDDTKTQQEVKTEEKLSEAKSSSAGTEEVVDKSTPQEAPVAEEKAEEPKTEEVAAPKEKIEELEAPKKVEEIEAPASPKLQRGEPKQPKIEAKEEEGKVETKSDLVEKVEASDKSVSDDAPAKSDLAKWYIVHTYSGHENKVAKSLKQRIESMGFENRIFDIIVPTRETFKVSQGKKETVKEKIFPGYVLIKMILDDESWLLVRTTQGVTAFIGAGNKPTPISDKEVEAIQKFMATEEPLYKASFTVGEAVKIVDGPFTDFLGTIDNIDEAKGKLKVLVSIFGRETPVELDFLQVSKL